VRPGGESLQRHVGQTIVTSSSVSLARERRVRVAIAAAAAPLVIAAGWVGLTAWTGKTYHLAPLLAAAAPGYLARFAGWPSRSRGAVLALVALGGVAVAGGWSVIVAAGIEPTATLVPGQPGGVPLEVAIIGLLGALLGIRQLGREAAGLPGNGQHRARREQGLGGSREASGGGEQTGDP